MKQTVIFAQESTTQSDHAVNTGERLVNVYPARAGGSARSDLVLRHCAGYGAELATVDTGVTALAACVGDTDIFVVADLTATGSNLYRIESDGTVTQENTVTLPQYDGISPGISCGAYAINVYRKIIVAPGGLGAADTEYYIYDDPNDTYSSGPAPSGPPYPPRTITFLSQYVIWSRWTAFPSSPADSRAFEWSELGDPSSNNALHVATKESSSDPTIRVIASQGYLYVMGTESFEIWTVSGQSGANAFQRVSQDATSVGLRLAPIAIDYEDGLYFLADDKTFLRAVGFSLERLSTPALEAVLQDNDPTHIFVYEHRGHKFVCLRFSDRPAWCFDITTGLWHERCTGDALGAWEIVCTVFAFNAWHGITEDGRIYAFDDTCADDATAMTRLAISRPLDINGDVFRVANLQVRAQPDDTSYDIDMRHSRDGGRNWSTARTYSMTSTNRSGRARWNGLGSGRLFQVELTLDDAVGAPIEAEAVIEVT